MRGAQFKSAHFLRGIETAQKMKTRVLINSCAHEGGDVRNFWLELRPTIENIRKVSLVWADIPNPLQSPGGPYFLIRIPELGTRSRVVGSSFQSAAAGMTTTTAGRRRGVVAAIATKVVVGVVANVIVDAITGEPVEEDPAAEEPAAEEPAAEPITYYNNQHGIETSFIVPITVKVDERVFYSPETSFRQEMVYNPPISTQRLSPAISRTYDATQITGESVLILELKHD